MVLQFKARGDGESPCFSSIPKHNDPSIFYRLYVTMALRIAVPTAPTLHVKWVPIESNLKVGTNDSRSLLGRHMKRSAPAETVIEYIRITKW